MHRLRLGDIILDYKYPHIKIYVDLVITILVIEK